jgi:hypothetical protein
LDNTRNPASISEINFCVICDDHCFVDWFVDVQLPQLAFIISEMLKLIVQILLIVSWFASIIKLRELIKR